MNEYDNEYGIVWAIYHNYLMCHSTATLEQTRLADQLYEHLCELRKKCDLYKNDDIEKPENYIINVTSEL